MGRHDLAHVEIDDLEPDTMGRGESDESFQTDKVTNDYAISNGYVRGSLSVIEGGRQTPNSFDNTDLGTNIDAATGTNDVSGSQAEVLTLPATSGKQLDLEYVCPRGTY